MYCNVKATNFKSRRRHQQL